MRTTLFTFILGLISAVGFSQFTYESILSEGDIYKIEINESGIYKLDREFVNSLNLNGEASNLAVYGQRGGIVPQLNSDDNGIDDMQELATHRVGLTDGSWDNGDYILFYAEGADTWKCDPKAGTYLDHNIYDLANYYYLKITDAPKTIQEEGGINADIVYHEYTKYQRYEEDNFNLLDESPSHYPGGKAWYLDIFRNTRERNYTDRFDFTGLVQGSMMSFEATGAARSSAFSTITLNVNDASKSAMAGTVNYADGDSRFAHEVNLNTEIEASTFMDISVFYPENGDSEGAFWLDYIEVEAQIEANYTGRPIFLTHRDMDQYNSVGFDIDGGQNIIVWNLSDHHGVTQLGSNNGVFTSITGGDFMNYVAFDPNNINLTPTLIGQVENQNLHGIERADMVIIYHQTFADQAAQLAAHRRQLNGFIVETIDIDLVWDEFSAGKVDPSGLRNLFKMLYQRDPAFKYAVLMGDASFDPRNIKNSENPGNLIPVYEKSESLQPIFSYPTDDYYALLDEGEGEETTAKDILAGDLDIAIGRFPVNTAEEAQGMVNKVIAYETSPDRFGPWRTEVLFAADDGNGTLHIGDSDHIARDVKTEVAEVHQTKVFFDAYNQVSTPGGERYPDATNDLFNEVQQGKLITCYLGHGGPKGWAQERVLQVEHINDWDNMDNMTVMITATCSFAGYDDPGLISAGEHAILNPKGGVAALLTTVRSVFTSSNEALTRRTWETLLDNTDPEVRIGDAFAQAKSSFESESTVSNSRKYTLLGDPAMRLAVPRFDIIPEMLNGISIESSESDTLLSALERGTITGSIKDLSGENSPTIEDFNGELFLTIYDKDTRVNTLVNDSESKAFSFDAQNTILFKGKSQVTNGQFSIDFVLPQNIKFELGRGQMYFYAMDLDNEIDAAGQSSQFTIGGSLADDNTDNIGPDIELFMNTYAFKDGGTTTPDPVLIATLFDESGINLSNTSIGHDLKATLDGDVNQSYVVNDFYEGSLDDYRRGEIRFPFRDLELGEHRVELTAWDILNNRNTAELSFVVSDGSLETLINVINYPNPSQDQTSFAFEHDGDAGDVLITIHIFDTQGKNVDILQYNRPSEGSKEVNLIWRHGDKNILSGIYVYRIEMQHLETNQTKVSDLQKLVIINN